MKPRRHSRLLLAIACSCWSCSVPPACAEDLVFSGNGTVRLPATDWAERVGGDGAFAGANDGGRLYWRGWTGDGNYLHLPLKRLAGLTVLSSASVTLGNSNDQWGGGVTDSYIATIDSPWTAARGAGIPGATPIADASNATGSYGSGVGVTWSIGANTFQGLVDNGASFHGLAIIGGAGSQMHFNAPMDPFLEVTTNAAMNGVVSVSGGAVWNPSSHSFANGVLTIQDSVAGGTSGAGAVTINALGTVFVNGSGGDNRYWAVDSTTVNAGGVLMAQGHSHLHNLTLAGGELGGIRPSGIWGGWSFDDATLVTGGVTSVISAQWMNFDNGGFTVESGATLDVTGSIRSGSITKNGGGVMLLGGGNGSGGGITINGGTLIATRSAQDDGVHTLGSGPLTINDGGTLRSTRNWTTSSEWNPVSVGAVTINQGGIWSIEGVGQTIYNGLYLNGGTITATVSHGDWGALHLKSDVIAGGNVVSTVSADVAVNWTRTIQVGDGSELRWSGVIHNQIGTHGGFVKAGAGTLVLSGTNRYTGSTVLAGGVVNASSFADNGTDCSLGNGTGDANPEAIGILFRGGTLQYTGSTSQSTNRQIRLSTTGGGGTIDASGSDPAATLHFTASSTLNFFENPGNRTLTLTGTNPGANTFSMPIGEAGGTTTLVKAGVGKWVVTAANGYTGSTYVDGGTLSLGNGSADTNLANASGVSIASGAVLDLNFPGSDEIGALVIDGIDQGSGVFNAGTHPGVITGSGSLVVLANDGIWVATGDGNWGVQSNWEGGKLASGTDKTASFHAAGGANVSLDSDRRVGHLSFANADQRISGNRKLILETSNGSSAVTVAGGFGATISAPLQASYGLRKSGSGMLVLDGSSDKVIGGIELAEGTVELNVPANLGGLTIGTGARFVVNGAWNFASSGSITIDQGGVLAASHVGNVIQSGLTLNGGTVEGGDSNSDWGAFTLASDVMAGGDTTSTISAEIGLAGAIRIFTVAGGSALNVSGVVHNSWQNGPVASGNYGSPSVLCKAGPGIMSLTAANGYTGETRVLEGTLKLGNGTNPSNLADGADVSVDTGAVLHLDFTGSDAVDELRLGGVAMSPGTYDSSHPSGMIAGTGSLVVSNGPPADPLIAWIDARWPGLTDKTAAGDPDQDGIANLLEYVLHGGDPSVAGTMILPMVDASGANLVFAFHRRAAAGGVTLVFEHGSDLVGWTAVPVVHGGQVSVTADTPSQGIDEVIITVPKSARTRMFGRLKATMP